MAAHVVFSDGSRRMAHNNEDLFERWRLRLESDAETRPNWSASSVDRQVDMFVPTLPTPTTLEDACKLRKDYLERRDILTRELTMLKNVYKGVYGGRAKAEAIRMPYKQAMIRVETELRRLKDWVNANTTQNADDTRFQVLHAERDMLRDSRDYWIARAKAAEARLAELMQEAAS